MNGHPSSLLPNNDAQFPFYKYCLLPFIRILQFSLPSRLTFSDNWTKLNYSAREDLPS